MAPFYQWKSCTVAEVLWLIANGLWATYCLRRTAVQKDGSGIEVEVGERLDFGSKRDLSDARSSC